MLPRLEADHCRQGRHITQEAARGAADLVCQVPSSKKRGRSLLAGRPPDSVERGLLDDPEDDEGPAHGAGAGPAAVGTRRGGAGAAPPAGGGAAGVLNK